MNSRVWDSIVLESWTNSIRNLNGSYLLRNIPYSKKLVLAGNFTPDELKLILHWFKYMFSMANEGDDDENDEHGSGEMTATAALNNAKELGFTLLIGQKLLNKLQADKWIIVVHFTPFRMNY